MKRYVLFLASLLMLMMLSCERAPLKLSFENLTCIARVTGYATDSLERLLNPNNTADDYNIGGTDLGIVWEMDEGEYGLFFGDSYGKDFFFSERGHGPQGSNWICNFLAFSKKENLDKGLTITNMAVDSLGNAREIIYGAKDTSGHGDWTSIPTGAIRANGVDYVHYMNIRHWTGANWGTNYSGAYKSTDNGQNWTKCEGVKFDEDSNFGQVGYWKKDGYVYMIGTESGRATSPRLARFLEKDFEHQTVYEYWNGDGDEWVKGDENKASNLFDDTVGELSFIYHQKTKQWIITYFCAQRYDITIRYASEINGAWSEPQTLVSGRDYPQLYGSYIHPLSADSNKIYFLMSMWQPYNVFLMRTDITIL